MTKLRPLVLLFLLSACGDDEGVANDGGANNTDAQQIDAANVDSHQPRSLTLANSLKHWQRLVSENPGADRR